MPRRAATKERSCVAGIDIGTSSVKVLVVDPEGRVVSAVARDYPLLRDDPVRAELDPDVVVQRTMQALRRAVKEARASGCRVEAISLSSAMHSLIAIDPMDRPMTPAITWADNRAADQAERFRGSADGLEVYRRTGTPIHAMSPLAKLLWFRDEEPRYLDVTWKWVSIKDFVLKVLTDELVTDRSMASATGLFSLETKEWDEGVLDLVGLKPDHFPELVPTTHVVQGLDPEIASSLRLSRRCPVVVGASDGALANVGAGALRHGSVVCSIGTSGAVRATSERPCLDEAGRLFCYVMDAERWIVGGPINNGGSALAWARRALYPDLGEDVAFEALDRAAEGVAPGAGGLIFLPYLLGERAPQWDSEARGVFFGLTDRHNRDDLLRALLEGVAMQLKSVLNLVEEVTGAKVEDVRATGGFARTESWRRILTEVLGRRVRFPSIHEGSAWGAAVLGMLALEQISSLDWVEEHLTFEDDCEPDPSEARGYARRQELFERLYGNLRGAFDEIAGIQSRE